MTNTPTSSQAPAPTPRQMAYLRKLAEHTGGTFAYPKTAREASSEIARLTGQTPDSPADRHRERRQLQRDLAENAGGATRIQDDEITGHGSTATWDRDPAPTPEPAPAAAPATSQVGARTELGRYTTSRGERVIYGQRVDGHPRLFDKPANGQGRSYLIETELLTKAEVDAIVADYLERARILDRVPM
jgi:hypothetical protein